MTKWTEKAKLQKENDRGFAVGVAVACGIAYGTFGGEVEVMEILRACGYETARKLKAAGADAYDVNILKPLFAKFKRNGK